MATVDEILATMSDDDTAVTAADELLIIDPNTRQINVPGIELTFGVESDAGSERKYFQCPRYVGDGLDLAGCFIRVNFRNANGEMDSYLVDDVTVNGDSVTFSWLLSQKVTRYKGQVKFVVCAVGPDLKVEWHTTLGTGIALEGLEPDTGAVTTETADVVAQLIAMVKARTTAVENTGAAQVQAVKTEGATQVQAVKTAAETAESNAVAEIEAKGVNTRESIPDDYTALSEAVDSLTRGCAGAIVCEAEGSAVAVSDASDNYIQGLRIFGRSTQDGTPTPDAPVEIVSVEKPVVTVCGKNVLKNAFVTRTAYGITATTNREDGSIVVTGAATGSAFFVVGNVTLPAGTYILSGCPDGGAVATYSMYTQIDGQYAWNVGAEKKFTLTKEKTVTVNIRVMEGATVDNQVFHPMIRLASVEDATYEPYSGQTVEITHTLPGIPVTSGGNYTDSAGQQWICDEVDLERGVYVQRVYGEVFDGSDDEIISIDQPGTNTYHYTLRTKYMLKQAIGLCSHYPLVGVYSQNSDEGFCPIANSIIRIRWGEEKTLAGFKAELQSNPVSVLYTLVTPIETALSETEIAAYRDLRSNYPNTTILNDSGAHMVVKYAADTKLYIDNKIATLIGG